MEFSKSQNQMSLNFKNQKRPNNPFGNLPKSNKMPNPEQVFDLTADDEPSCDICEDDFNWPDANHACPLKQNKKMKIEHPTNTTEPKKGGLAMLKEKIFKSNKPLPLRIAPKKINSNISIDTKKKQLEDSVRKIPNSTKLIPINNMPKEVPSRVMPTRTSTRAMPTRTMPTRTVYSRIMPTRTV